MRYNGSGALSLAWIPHALLAPIGVLLTREFGPDDISSVHAGKADTALAMLAEWRDLVIRVPPLMAGRGVAESKWRCNMRAGESGRIRVSQSARIAASNLRYDCSCCQIPGKLQTRSAQGVWTGFGEVGISSSTLSNRFGTNARFLSCPKGPTTEKMLN